jgi:hypothetical protein
MLMELNLNYKEAMVESLEKLIHWFFKKMNIFMVTKSDSKIDRFIQ